MDYDSGCRIRESWSDLDHFVEVESIGFDHVEIQEKNGIRSDSQDPGLSSSLDAYGTSNSFYVISYCSPLFLVSLIFPINIFMNKCPMPSMSIVSITAPYSRGSIKLYLFSLLLEQKKLFNIFSHRKNTSEIFRNFNFALNIFILP